MNEIPYYLFTLLMDVSLKALCLAVLIEIVLRIKPLRNSPLVHGIWIAILAGMLAFPLLTLLVPNIYLPILPVSSLQLSSVIDCSFYQIFTLIYLLGVGIMAGRLGIGFILTRRMLRISTIYTSREWNGYCTQLFSYKIIPRKLSLWICPAINVPMTIGCLKVKIILPTKWHDWDVTKKKAVLAHELAHVRRYDYLFQLMVTISQTLYWFHPLVWLLSPRLSLLAEQACDDCAILFVGDKRQYAQHLLEIASSISEKQGRVVLAALSMVKPSQIHYRINAILDGKRSLRRQLSRSYLFILLFVAISSWATIASLHLVRKCERFTPLPSFTLDKLKDSSPIFNCPKIEQRHNVCEK